MATETKEVSKTKDVPTQMPAPKTPREVIERERAEHPILAVAAHLPTNIDEPFPVPTPLSAPTPDEEARAKAKAEVLKKIGELLAKYNNNESEVPVQNEYWSLIAQYRSM